MKTDLRDLKAANTEDVKERRFIDSHGRKWTITNIEKEFWADAFRIAERAERSADAEDIEDDNVIGDCICDDCNEDCDDICNSKKCWSDGAEEVQDVSNCN